MNAKRDDISQEIVERLRRVETRLVQVADHIGVDVRAVTNVQVLRMSPLVVMVSSLDCSASRIVNVLKLKGITSGMVDVMLRGDTRVSMTLNLDYLQ